MAEWIRLCLAESAHDLHPVRVKEVSYQSRRQNLYRFYHFFRRKTFHNYIMLKGIWEDSFKKFRTK